MNKKVFLGILLGVLALVIVPLLVPWYIFSLDQVLNVNWWIPSVWSNIFWVGYLSQIFVFFHIPVWVMEKFLVLMTFVLPLWGGYLLLKDSKYDNNYWILFALLLLIFNPFLYGRFIDGQINVYLSYSMYPLFLYLLKQGFEKFTIRNLVFVVLWSLLLCLTSLHNAVFLFFVFLIFFLVYGIQLWWKKVLLFVLSLILAHLTWLLPLLQYKTSSFWLIQQIQDFDVQHQMAFQTQKWTTNVYVNTLSLHGYWWEVEHRFINTWEYNSIWYIIFALIFLLACLGVYYKISSKKIEKLDYVLIILAGVSFVFALGIADTNIFSFINTLLYNYFPFYKGMREPHKWVMFLVIFYMYFWAWGIKYLQHILKKYLQHILKKYLHDKVYLIFALYLVAFLPVLYVPRTFLGYSWQVQIHQYPKDWEDIKEKYWTSAFSSVANNCSSYLQWASQSCYRVVSFPWHSYLAIPFTKKVVLWGIINYFWSDILVADNLEMRDIYTQSTRAESKIIEHYIWPQGILRGEYQEKDLENFLLDMQWLWINYIFLLKTADYTFYEDIMKQLIVLEKIELLEDRSSIWLYRLF